MRLAWIVVFALGLPLAASDEPLVVRAYNTYGLSAAELQTASETVTRLLSEIATHVRWRNCVIAGRRTRDKLDPCAEQLARNEFIVRIVAGDRAPADVDSAVLGYSFIDPVQHVGSLATIYADRAVSPNCPGASVAARHASQSGFPSVCAHARSRSMVFAPMPRAGTLITRARLASSSGLCTSRR